MATDPKKDQEIRDENLEDAAGGRQDVESPSGGDVPEITGESDRIRTKV